ncbi:MAG: TonB-dependent receptor [Alphaproteobacteria bacterium]|nr:TonB-dependent receptor [Alphaproteobacteria bacterium]
MRKLFFLCILTPTIAFANDPTIKQQFQVTDDEVFTLSKKPENAFQAASAIYVISQEDIRRAGITTVPEALRLAPGVEVAQIDSNKWAITSRGFNRQFVNKMLVLIDGRTVYTPLFAGVYWDMQDLMIEDIERIEVVRGPGATIWGTNAVNGVINIITYSSKGTQGNLASAVYGNEQRGNLAFRHGGRINDKLHYRVYGKYDHRDDSHFTDKTNGNDTWENGRTGYRMDWDASPNDLITFQGDISNGYEDYTLNPPSLPTAVTSDEEIIGANQMVKWQRNLTNHSITTNAYVDYTSRDSVFLEQKYLTFDLDFQDVWTVNPSHELSWGLGYHYFRDNLKSLPVSGVTFIDYTPDKTDNDLYSVFLQDQWSIIPDKLLLTLGSKFEHNYYTDWETQPTIRLSYLPDEKQTIWSSISRAIRIPSRAERTINLAVANTGFGLIRQVGQPGYDSEKLTAYELGYRNKIIPSLTFDVSAFYNVYQDLRSLEFSGLNMLVENQASGKSHGIEVAAQWTVLPGLWYLQGSYSYLHLDIDNKSGSTDILNEKDEGASPQNQYKIQSSINLSHNVEFDQTLYFVDNLRTLGINAYTRFDLHLAWKPVRGLELSVAGQNLLDNRHQEFSPDLYSKASEIGRSIYGKVVWEF